MSLISSDLLGIYGALIGAQGAGYGAHASMAGAQAQQLAAQQRLTGSYMHDKFRRECADKKAQRPKPAPVMEPALSDCDGRWPDWPAWP